MENKKKNIDSNLDDFLGMDNTSEDVNGELTIKQDKSILEKINKRVITEDGRQLL